MLRIFLSGVLLLGVLNALPTETQKGMDPERQKDFNLAMYVDAPRPYASNGSPNSPSSSGGGGAFSSAFASAVVIQGWTASATGGTVTVNATDIYSCLDACRTVSTSTDPRCRLVSFNIETNVCTKFFKSATATGRVTFSRNTDMMVAAFSEKRFQLLPSTDFNGDDISFTDGIATADFCKLFCHVHPTCNVATFDKVGTGNCYMKSKTSLNGSPSQSGTSYVS